MTRTHPQSGGHPVNCIPTALALAACMAAPAIADSPYPAGSHRKLVESVGAAESETYREIVEAFDAHLSTVPLDIVARVERCRFITDFAYREETAIESAYDDSEACIEELTDSGQSGRPEVQLFLLEQKWGDDAIREAEELLRSSGNWPAPQRGALHARLSELFAAEDQDKAGRHAMMAVTLDPATRLQIDAADFQVRIGAKGRAVGLVRSFPVEGWDTWTLQRAVDVMVRAGDPGSAYALVKELPAIELNLTARVGLARALLDAGLTEAGKALLDAAPAPPAGEEAAAYGGYLELREVFELRRDFGTAAEATGAYQELRDVGWRADPFAWYRLSLASADARAPLRGRDLLGFGSLLLALFTVALLPLLIIAPIHYRSLANRLRGIAMPERTSASPWNLRQMWYAMAAILTLMLMAAYVVAYPQFEELLAPAFDAYPVASGNADSAQLARAYMLGTVLGLLAMIPLLRGTTRETWLGTRWRPARSLIVGVSLAVGLVTVAAVFKGLLAWRGIAVGPGSETFRAMQGIDEILGPWALVAFASILTPALEEFVFRGVVLRTCARHLALWTAVVIQAVIFVAWHEEVGDFPVLFLFALCGAWLALRSGGLLAPIAFHAGVNLIAVTTILNFSRFVSQSG
jgi:uncharacterized protein